MKLKKFFFATGVPELVIFIFAGVYYPLMPEVMASHWNAKVEADGIISRFLGMFLFPIMSPGMAAILLVIPEISPLKATIQKFNSYSYVVFRKLGQIPQLPVER
jgi:uncharacterized membrane protein